MTSSPKQFGEAIGSSRWVSAIPTMAGRLGQLAVVTTSGDIYQNTDGGTTWVLFASNGGGPASDITGVTAGDGLTGGGTSGTVTLDVVAGANIAVTANAVALATNVEVAGTLGAVGIFRAKADAARGFWINNDQIGCGLDVDADDYCLVNYTGFAGGTTRFRDFSVCDGKNNEILRIEGSGTKMQHKGAALGFYNTAPIAKQTGVAVTDVAIHAALVALGLIGA